ncbi:uncharacterized protein LOC128678260 isoform X2 [Plodia interpunctella]|nr:uncharacterized protein LOC128678260 isoform X2 [Plodia interpunctella]
MQANSEVLHGVVALVDVGAEARALPLRAALSAMGATVVPCWSPLVTHLVWAQGGCRATRAKARALACQLVSPLWAEACAGAARRLPERAFPAAARASDLPSPTTLRQLLKKAEMENVPLLDLLSDKEEERENRPARLRLSSETDHDTSADTSRDTSKDTSNDKSRDTTTDIESRVNTAPRRALPNSSVRTRSPPPSKSRRKLFTQREAELLKKSDDDSDGDTPGKRAKTAVTQRDRKQLARAERMAKKLVTACSTPAPAQGVSLRTTLRPRIVLTGMDRTERHAMCEAIRKLNGRIQSHVNRKTTHVLLGSCTRSESPNRNCSGVTALNITNKNTSSTKTSPKNTRFNTCSRLHLLKSPKSVNNVTSNPINTCSRAMNNVNNVTSIVSNEMRVVHRSELQKARTLNALLGAVRGCRVLNAQWALDSVENNAWLHHHGYEVPHLKKISQKARIERTAFGKMRSEYAYDVFYGIKVRVTTNAEQKDAVIQLLTLCGAVVQNGGDIVRQDGGLTQHGGRMQQNVGLTQNCGRVLQQNDGLTRNGAQNGHQNFDLTVGVRNGEVSSKWVFDSVAAARMRTTRRYINNIHNT